MIYTFVLYVFAFDGNLPEGVALRALFSELKLYGAEIGRRF